MRGIFGLIFVFSAAACGDTTLKAEGQECFGSAECAQGLTCDFGQSPAVCAPNQSNLPPDASTEPAIDADPDLPDAMPLPDGDPGAVSLAMTPEANQDCGTDPAGLLAGLGSACVTYTVTNTGGVTSAALGVALSDAVNFEIVGDTCTGNTFVTDATCTIDVEHRPQDVEVTHNATVTVSEASVPDVVRAITGIGTSALSSAPTSVDFGDVAVGNNLAGPLITITNAANTPTTAALGVTINGVDAAEFGVVSDCVAATVAAAATCTATVTFTPATVANGKTATLDITDGTPNKTVSIPLTANGI